MCKNKQFNSWKSMSKKYFYKTKFLVTSFKINCIFAALNIQKNLCNLCL